MWVSKEVDRGSITLEYALALPVLVLVLAFSAGLLLVVGGKGFLENAAFEAARSAAVAPVGKADARAAKAAKYWLPGSIGEASELSTSRSSTVTTAKLAVLGPLGLGGMSYLGLRIIVTGKATN